MHCTLCSVHSVGVSVPGLVVGVCCAQLCMCLLCKCANVCYVHVHVSVVLCACGSSCLCRKTRIPVSRTPRSSSCTLLDILNPSIIIITTMMMNTMVMNSDAPLLEEESLCRQLAIINILTNSFKKHLKHCSPCIYVPIYERHSARHTVHIYETNKHQYTSRNWLDLDNICVELLMPNVNTGE